MHQTILIRRRAVAMDTLINASEKIVEHLELNPDLKSAFHPVGIRDSEVRDMMIIEAAAALMLHLGVLSGSIQEGVTTITDQEESADVSPAALPPSPEDSTLPPPVMTPIDEGESPAEETKQMEEPAAEDLPAEEESVQEETPTETPKRTNKRKK